MKIGTQRAQRSLFAQHRKILQHGNHRYAYIGFPGTSFESRVSSKLFVSSSRMYAHWKYTYHPKSTRIFPFEYWKRSLASKDQSIWKVLWFKKIMGKIDAHCLRIKMMASYLVTNRCTKAFIFDEIQNLNFPPKTNKPISMTSKHFFFQFH